MNIPENIPQYFWGALKDKAKRRKIPLLLSKEDMENLFIKQKGLCYFTGLPLVFGKYRESSKRTASLDRLDNNKPYSLDNVVWVHKTINMMKWKFGVGDFVRFCKLVAKNKKFKHA